MRARTKPSHVVWHDQDKGMWTVLLYMGIASLSLGVISLGFGLIASEPMRYGKRVSGWIDA